MILASIRWRLLAWHGTLLAVVVAGFGVTAHRLATGNRLREIDEDLQSRSAQLGIAFPPGAEAEAGRQDGRRPPPRGGGSLPELATAGGAYFIIWLPNGKIQARSANVPIDLAPPPHAPGDEWHGVQARGTAREWIRFTKADRCFLVGRDIGTEQADLRRLAGYLAVAGFGVWGGGLVVGWRLSSRALRPIGQISAAAADIASGDLSRRIDAAGFAQELQGLAGTLNATFDRLDDAFAQQARFTADAAHELRTPVSVILLHARNGLASEALDAEQREAFAACERAARRMQRLIESLLELARIDAREDSLPRVIFDLAATARESAEMLAPLARQHAVTLRCEGKEVRCNGQPERIAQVIANLLANAIEHTPEGGEVRVATRTQEGRPTLEVADSGPGIAAEDLPHVFERFYRADRARSSGHAGLGLSICRAIAREHGGTINAASPPGGGALFTLRLPPAPAPAG